jgi:hypothetical protein
MALIQPNIDYQEFEVENRFRGHTIILIIIAKLRFD